jgi:hypothetical protein
MLLEKYPSHFIEDVVRHTDIASSTYNFCCKQKKDFIEAHDDFVFFGYPAGNYLKQVSFLGFKFRIFRFVLSWGSGMPKDDFLSNFMRFLR